VVGRARLYDQMTKTAVRSDGASRVTLPDGSVSQRSTKSNIKRRPELLSRLRISGLSQRKRTIETSEV
jgi:hypothetical protein